MRQSKPSRKPENAKREQPQAAPIVDKFKCPCGKGWILSEYDPRSRNKDRMTTLQCPHCAEQYVILNEKSFDWTLVPRDYVD